MSSPIMNPVQIGILRQLLSYDPQTGGMLWKERISKHFADGYRSAQGKCNNWNSKMAGKPAFTFMEKGYLNGRVFGKPLKAHRVAWALHHGEWPHELDHINGNRADNRIANLRSVTRQENRLNVARTTRNTSGATGVTWEKRRGIWRATITAKKKTYFLGYFNDKSKAIAARKLGEREHGFHQNHGRSL